MSKKFFSIITVVIITISLIIFIEFFYRFLFFKENIDHACYVKVDDERTYKNAANCNYSMSYFESKEDVIYYTDKFGNRVRAKEEKKTGNKKIFFVGDSFTFGFLSNYEYTYPFSSVKKINLLLNENYEEINKGVNGYQFSQVLINILKDEEIKFSNDLIIYGMTPNDIFDHEDKYSKTYSTNKVLLDKKSNFLLFLEDIAKSSYALKYFASIILRNDKIYNAIYLSRNQVVMGFAQDEISNLWKKKYKIVENLIHELPNNIKNRLVILIVPQKIQINLINNNEIAKATYFDKEIFRICKKLKIKCISLTKELATLKNTHFTIDGHMLPEANKLFGELLGKKIVEFNFLISK